MSDHTGKHTVCPACGKGNIYIRDSKCIENTDNYLRTLRCNVPGCSFSKKEEVPASAVAKRTRRKIKSPNKSQVAVMSFRYADAPDDIEGSRRVVAMRIGSRSSRRN